MLMSIGSLQVVLDKYFYPKQSVVSLLKFDKDGSKDQSKILLKRTVTPIPNRSDMYALEIEIKLDTENSINPPYDFEIVVVGYFIVADKELDSSAGENLTLNWGSQLLIGAIRERLSMLTQSAPWGVFNINFIPIPNAPEEKSKEQSATRPLPKKKEVKRRAVKRKTAKSKAAKKKAK